MDKFLEKLIKELSSSPTELTEKNIKKMHEYIPVPSDFKILWADINSFGGYPSGVVLTNRGIVCKAPRPTIKEKKKQKKNEEIYRIPYQVLLWEYFDPSDIVCEKLDEERGYVIKREDIVLSVFQEKSLIDFFKKYNEKLRHDEMVQDPIIDSAIWGEVENLNFDSVVFNAAYGENQSKTGHGIYAEEAGAILEKLSGEESAVVGRDNAKNGPDKIVNGSPVQCKFCKTAGSSVGACFKKNVETGKMEYKYFESKTGNPMKVEVPADQYEKALEVMKRRITDGQIPGVNDPEKAKDIVKKSKLTYAQAKNLAKAGTFESLTYDAVTGVISCSFAAGMSALTSFGLTYWRTNDPRKARNAAIDAAINVFGPALAANIIANQIAKTGLNKVLIPMSNKIVQRLGNKMVQKLINARRVLLGKGKIYGNAANKSLAKALRSNMMGEGVMFVVFSVPDTYRVITGKISGAQYTKNMLSAMASIVGTWAGTNGSGLVAGRIFEKLGKKIDKKFGAVIGFAAAASGGIIFGYAVNKLTGLFKEDDCIITARLFNSVIVNMAVEYFMDDKEIDILIKELDDDSKKIGKFQIKLRNSKHQYYDTQKFLEPYFERAISNSIMVQLSRQKSKTFIMN